MPMLNVYGGFATALAVVGLAVVGERERTEALLSSCGETGKSIP